MARKHRYPKKFRQTLEKIAEKREARETSSSYDKVFNTLFQEFLMPGQVHTIRTGLNDELNKINTVYQLEPDPRPEYAVGTPPWMTPESPVPS